MRGAGGAGRAGSLRRPGGPRIIPLADLHRLPGDRPDIETELQPHELITAVELPPLPFAARSTYRKVRDRASYAFALISVAAALDIGADGHIRDVRLALGGVAHKPWRAWRAEGSLCGKPASEASFQAAADAVALHDDDVPERAAHGAAASFHDGPEGRRRKRSAHNAG